MTSHTPLRSRAGAFVLGFCLPVLALVGIPSCRHRNPFRSAPHQELIAQVILHTIDDLPDSVEAWYPAPTPDSARAMFQSMWLGWWHTALQNDVALSPEVRARFSRHLDLSAVPPDPSPEIDRHYRARKLRTLDDSTLSVEIGVSFSGCRYTFVRRASGWQLADREPEDCWLS